MSRTLQAPELPSAAEICSRTREVFGKTPCLFQIELCHAQLRGYYLQQDIISVASTGSGKTLCFLMPLLFNNHKITIIITALNLLGEQFCRQAKGAGISAIAVTAINNTRSTFQVCESQKSAHDVTNHPSQSIRDGVYQVILINPEILLQRNGFCKNILWSNKSFMAKVFNFVFDEGHCIVQWGSTFCLL
jgi:superfamily II DNA helicase RecQ